MIIVAIIVIIAFTALMLSEGAWECDTSKPYGNRCTDTGTTYKDRHTCEARCLAFKELHATAENLIEFTHEKGVNFAVPVDFLQQLFIDHDSALKYSNFLQRKEYSMWKALLMYTQLNVFEAVCKKIENIDVGLISVITNAKGTTFDRFVLNTEHPISVYRVLYIHHSNGSHANSLVINNITKRIYSFEPNVGTGFAELAQAMSDACKDLVSSGYQFESSTTCPLGLQSVTHDNLCASWTTMATIMIIKSPSKTMSEILAYLTGIRVRAKNALDIFLYYLSTLDLDLDVAEINSTIVSLGSDNTKLKLLALEIHDISDTHSDKSDLQGIVLDALELIKLDNAVLTKAKSGICKPEDISVIRLRDMVIKELGYLIEALKDPHAGLPKISLIRSRIKKQLMLELPSSHEESSCIIL